MASNERISVWPIIHGDDAERYGTGVVVHTRAADEAGTCTAFLVTCSHVVTDIGERRMTVGGCRAELVSKGRKHDTDLAVIKVVLPANRVQAMPADPTVSQYMSGEVRGYCRTESTHDLTPLHAQVTKFIVPVPHYGMPAPAKVQVTVELDEGIEPDQIEKGYSGSPLVVDGSVRAVVDARRLAVERDRFKVGTAVRIGELEGIWPQMPDVLRRQIAGVSETPEPIRHLLQLNAQVPSEIARNVFDIAYNDLPSWPSRDGARDFSDCLCRLRNHDCVELEDQRYHPLGVYLQRVADALELSDQPNDPETPQQLRQAVTAGDYEPSTLPGTRTRERPAEPQEALVLRIVRDVDGIEEAGGAEVRLRVLPYLWKYDSEPCPEQCNDGVCRCVSAVEKSRLFFLGGFALETSTARLIADLQGSISEWFTKFCGGLPNRVQFFVPRPQAEDAMMAGVDSVPIRLDDGNEGNLNAWAAASYHIDDRLNSESGRKQLAVRLEERSGAIKLATPAKTLKQLSESGNTNYDFVVVKNENAPFVISCLRDASSVICALFRSADTARRNLSSALRSSVPIVLVSRSSGSAATLNRLLGNSTCLRRFPHDLQQKAASGAASASQIAAIIDLPEYGCDFNTAELEPMHNENP